LLSVWEFNTQVTAIEEMIAQGAEMQTILRLLCLASIVGGGIKTKALESVKREFLQAYGYQYLPLLLSVSTPPLAVLLPNPLPAATAAEFAPYKYPYSTLRKQLRLLHDDNESPEELENDVSYVYSGFAPISVRLVQCVAQKGGVLSTPAIDKAAAGQDGDQARAVAAATVRAHPIVGWKGFEDVVAAIPGETFDIVQTSLGAASSDLLSVSCGSVLVC
jgi:vacuolar protein sorting-associated protein 33A